MQRLAQVVAGGRKKARARQRRLLGLGHALQRHGGGLAHALLAHLAVVLQALGEAVDVVRQHREFVRAARAAFDHAAAHLEVPGLQRGDGARHAPQRPRHRARHVAHRGPCRQQRHQRDADAGNQRAAAFARVGRGVAKGLHQADGRVARRSGARGREGIGARGFAQRDGRGEHAQLRERRGLGPGRDVHARAVADFHARDLPAAQRGVGHVLQRRQVARVQAQVGHGRDLPRDGLALGVEGGFEGLQPAVGEPARERQRHRRARHHAQAKQVVLQVAAHDERVQRRRRR